MGGEIHGGAAVVSGEAGVSGLYNGFGLSGTFGGDAASAHLGGGANMTVDVNKRIMSFSLKGDAGLLFGAKFDIKLTLPIPSY